MFEKGSVIHPLSRNFDQGKYFKCCSELFIPINAIKNDGSQFYLTTLKKKVKGQPQATSEDAQVSLLLVRNSKCCWFSLRICSGETLKIRPLWILIQTVASPVCYIINFLSEDERGLM